MDKVSTNREKYVPFLFYPSLLIWLFSVGSLLDRILSDGRGSYSLFYDDVSYALVGQQLAIETSVRGWPAIFEWIIQSPHSPFSEGIAFLVHWISPSFSEGLYISNVAVASLLTLWLGSVIFKAWHSRLIFSASILALPFGYIFSNEYRPDVWFTLLGSISLSYSLLSLKKRYNERSKIAYIVALITLIMCFIKPAWFVIAFFTGIASGIGLLRNNPENIVQREKIFKRLLLPIIVVLIGLGIWYLWLGKHFFSYVLGTALNMDYRLAGSGNQAIYESISQAMGYLGNASYLWIWVVLSAIVSTVLSISFSVKSKRKIQLKNLLWSLTFWIAAGGTIFATWYSTHPSPFQGLFSIWILSIWGIVTLTQNYSSLGPKLNSHKYKFATLFALGILILASPIFTKSGLMFNPSFKAPNSPPQIIGKLINNDCFFSRDCSLDIDGISVMVTVMEDLNPASVEYYLQAENLQDYKVAQPSEKASDSARVVEEAKKYNYIVLRKTNYLANSVPLNAIQESIIRDIRDSGSFSELDTNNKLTDYIIFVNEKLTPKN